MTFFDDHHRQTIDHLEFRIRNNVDWNVPFQLSDYDPNTHTRTPHDLNGATIRMQLFELYPSHGGRPAISSSPSLDASTTNSMFTISSDGTSGNFTLNVPAETMWAIAEGSYIGDCLVFGTDGTVKPAYSISVEIEQGETPPTP